MRKLLLFLVLSPLAAFGQNAVGNITILGATCAVTNACVIDTLATSSSSANITLTGTWSATVQFEASPDGGTTWVAINGTPPSSTTAVTSSTANGVWTFNVGSMTHLRARASALASGSVGVTINASPAPILVGGSSSGGTVTSVSGTTNQIDVATGTTTPVISIDAAFQLPISTGISGLGTGIATFLTTPTSANLASALTDETGTGAAVFAGSPALTGTPTAPTAARTVNTTQLATTAFVQSMVAPLSNPYFNTCCATPATGVTFGATLNVLQSYGQYVERPMSTTSLTYDVGTTADNTSATYDIGLYTGTAGGTCTLVADLGPIAGTTFAPAANAVHTINWVQGTVVIPAGRVYYAFTTSQAGTPTTLFRGLMQNSFLGGAAQVSITTGGTLPGTFTCPADSVGFNTAGGGASANTPSLRMNP